jgi:hypothetical protein
VGVPPAAVGVRVRDDLLAAAADWHQAGVWQRLHEVLLAELHGADRLDWSRAAVDGSHVRALKGGRKPAPARSIGPGPARSTT